MKSDHAVEAIGAGRSEDTGSAAPRSRVVYTGNSAAIRAVGYSKDSITVACSGAVIALHTGSPGHAGISLQPTGKMGVTQAVNAEDLGAGARVRPRDARQALQECSRRGSLKLGGCSRNERATAGAASPIPR